MSKYQLADNKSMKGMQVKLTFTFSGAGISTPLFTSVTSMNEK